MQVLPSLRENFAGAWAIMRGRPEGLARLDLSLEGFWRSFAAILLLVPFALLALISQQRLVAASGEAPGALSGGGLAVEAVALLADWFTFPLVFALLARPLGLGARYVPFIVARNWAAVIIAAMVAVVHAMHVLGLVPSPVAPFLLFAAIALALRFSYVIARTTLAVSAGVAIPLVILDLLISLTVWTVVDRIA